MTIKTVVARRFVAFWFTAAVKVTLKSADYGSAPLQYSCYVLKILTVAGVNKVQYAKNENFWKMNSSRVFVVTIITSTTQNGRDF